MGKTKQRNQPTKDKMRRRQVDYKFSRETVRPTHLVISQAGLSDKAILAAQDYARNAAIPDAQIGEPETNQEIVRPGPMCLQSLVRSPHFQAHIVRIEAQAA